MKGVNGGDRNMVAISRLESYVKEMYHLYSALELLQWDLEVCMPGAGVTHRAETIATISKLLHQKSRAPEYGELIESVLELEGLDDGLRKQVEVLKWKYERAVKIPEPLLTEIRRNAAIAYTRWVEAKRKSDFRIFAPHLEKLLNLMRELAQALYNPERHTHLYDALLEEYDRAATTALLDRVFGKLKQEFIPFVKEISEKYSYDDAILRQYFPKDKQWEFSLFVLKKIGLQLDKVARQDYSPHPFTVSVGPYDVRITTRVDEYYLPELLLASLHEMGHALYDLGTSENAPDKYGMPITQTVSLSIHESQSRFWENHIGRNLHFWKYFYPILQATFPDQLLNVSLEDFYRAWNKVKPTLIRVGADELTYHLHIIIRYEIEFALFSGDLTVKEAPAAWSELYHKYLGVKPEKDSEGILQDVHWAHASFGYFPTYTLGTLYSAQFWHAMTRDIPDVEEQLESGEFSSILKWLKDKIYKWGELYDSEELCRMATGEPLNPNYFIIYTRKKYEELVPEEV